MASSDKKDHVAIFRPEYFDVFGDHLVALMFAQIVYWYHPDAQGKSKLQKERDDKWWLIKSHVDWWDELRLTRKQSSRCLDKLREMGLIETKKWLFNGHPTIHLRCTLISGRVLYKEQLGTLLCALKSNPLCANAQCITETTAETTTKTVAPDGALIAPMKTGEETHPTKTGEPMPTAAEILAKHQNKKMDTPAKITASTLAHRWKKLLSADGTYVKELTSKQLGQLKHLLKALGDNALSTLDYAVQNWTVFTWEVKSIKGLNSAPTQPDIGFLQQYHDVAVQLIAKAESKQLEKVATEVLPTPSTIEPPFDSPATSPDTPVEKPVTADDIADTLAKLEAITNGS